MRTIFLEIFIAARYLRGQGRMVLFSLGTRLSFVFMSLMVYIMVIVLSVFNGFQSEVHRSLWSSGYHVTISRTGNPIVDYDAITKAVLASKNLQPSVKSAFGSIQVNGLLEIQNRFEGKAVRAIPVDAEGLKSGKLKDYPEIVHYNKQFLEQYDRGNYVIVGREMARFYGWQVGDTISVVLPQGAMMRKGMAIRREPFVIAGFFRTGFYEFDLNLIFMSLPTAQRVLDLNGQVTEVIVQLKDLSNLDYVRSVLRDELPENPYLYTIRTLKDERGNFLAALQLEKTLMIIIMGLLILAGAAGIWVTVHLLVQAKSKSIGMLRAMGLATRSILVIFTAHSMLIGLLSTIVGGSIGIFVANRLESIIQLSEDMANSACRTFSDQCSPVQLIPKNIYYFDHLPVYADLNVIFGVAIATMILSGLAGYFPSRRAAIVDPVHVLRNE
ncbi:MAG: FtsX-like permease family protein [Spirochaetia bacterium]|nr:FtsX-like permease family protein [Spirochaetia bacterium]